MKIIIGTTNQNKIKQIKLCLEKIGFKDVELLTLKDIGFYDEIEETGSNFKENSMIKARVIKNFCDSKGIHEMIITDDSGLCIDALNGEPGLYSARYGGKYASQLDKINMVLTKMRETKNNNRNAQFVCAITLVDKNGKFYQECGETKGIISETVGELGKLTYGPIFIPEGCTKCLNELENNELNEPHRLIALKKLINQLKNN